MQVAQAQAAEVPLSEKAAAPNAAHRHSAIAETAAIVVPLSAEHAAEAQAAAQVAAIAAAAEAEASAADDAKRRKPKQTI